VYKDDAHLNLLKVPAHLQFCSLPLSRYIANLPKKKASQFFERRGFCIFWWRFRDSNPGPADYDSVALTD
jgi:hypothetical protein